MDNMERKAIKLELKEDGELGSFTARIATLGVIDHDGDLTESGAFPKGVEVLVSAYQHGSWMGTLPVGKAVIREDGDEVLADGQFNLGTSSGKDTYETVKFSADLQEWSYGFQVLAAGSDKDIEAYADKHDGARPERIITKVDPFEISPVLKGAGIGTATVGIKNQGMPFAEQMEAVLAAVTSMSERAKSLADLRRKEGRDLSSANRTHLESLLGQLDETKSELEVLLTKAEPKNEDRDRAQSEYAKFLHTQMQILLEVQ